MVKRREIATHIQRREQNDNGNDTIDAVKKVIRASAGIVDEIGEMCEEDDR